MTNKTVQMFPDQAAIFTLLEYNSLSKQQTLQNNKQNMIFCPNSSIFDLCKHRDWRRVELECNREPSNAAYNIGDDIGSLSLHVACKKQPTARVIRSLLKAYPKAAHTYDANGYLPLHIACLSNASIEVLQTLTDDDPETASIFTTAGESTIAIVSRARSTTERHVDFHDPTLWQSETMEINYGTLYWQKIQVLLEAIAIHRQSSSLQCIDDLFTLHAAVSLSWCPADVLYFCCFQYPEQIRMIDDTGCLPLHLAVKRTAYYRSNETIAGKLNLREKSIIIPRLVQLYPGAAKKMDPSEPKGRFPLHTALINKHEWHGGVIELHQNFPDATLTKDPVENLYPFQLASHDLDTAFQLLRRAPSALLNLLPLRKYVERPTTIHQTHIHSPPRTTPRQREKRSKNIKIVSHMEYHSLNVPILECTKSQNNCSNHDIYFSVNDKGKYLTKGVHRDLIWKPPSYERRRQRRHVEMDHPIPEIIFAEKSFHASGRRGRKSSVVPSVIVAASEHFPNVEPMSVEETEHLAVTSIVASAEDFFSEGQPIGASEENFYSEGQPTVVYEDFIGNIPSEQSVDTRMIQNLNVKVLSTCSQTQQNDDSTSSNHISYNKYKCMISTSTAQNDKLAHGWNQDVVIRKLHTQSTYEI